MEQEPTNHEAGTESTPEKRFTIYVNCEGEEFQDRAFASAIIAVLDRIRGNIATGRFSGAITDNNSRTYGNWKTTWRNADPGDRAPPRRGSR